LRFADTTFPLKHVTLYCNLTVVLLFNILHNFRLFYPDSKKNVYILKNNYTQNVFETASFSKDESIFKINNSFTPYIRTLQNYRILQIIFTYCSDGIWNFCRIVFALNAWYEQKDRLSSRFREVSWTSRQI